MKIRDFSWKFAGVCGVGFFSVIAFAAGPPVDPLVYFTFDGADARIANQGALGAKAELRMYDGIGVTTQLLTKPGAGVKGRALKTGATHDVFGSFGHALAIPFQFTNAFTITGWFKRDAAKGGNLVSNSHDGKGFNLALDDSGSLVFTVSGVPVASRGLSFDPDAWVFCAAVWEMAADGQATATLYSGGRGIGLAIDSDRVGAKRESVERSRARISDWKH